MGSSCRQGLKGQHKDSLPCETTLPGLCGVSSPSPGADLWDTFLSLLQRERKTLRNMVVKTQTASVGGGQSGGANVEWFLGFVIQLAP